MIESPLRVLAPHYCVSCGTIGQILCMYCKCNIESEQYEACLVCSGPVGGGEALCSHHILPYSRAWCVGERSAALRALLDQYKFERAKDTYHELAQLLDLSLPVLPEDVVVVPVPTIAPHIRRRGFDHTALVAKELAKRRGLIYQHAIERVTTTSQLGKGKRDRRKQAAQAFACVRPAQPGRYLLIDDIFTTGATVEFAAQALRDAGATEVWLAIVARQPLEK